MPASDLLPLHSCTCKRDDVLAGCIYRIEVMRVDNGLDKKKTPKQKENYDMHFKKNDGQNDF